MMTYEIKFTNLEKKRGPKTPKFKIISKIIKLRNYIFVWKNFFFHVTQNLYNDLIKNWVSLFFCWRIFHGNFPFFSTKNLLAKIKCIVFIFFKEPFIFKNSIL